MAILTDIGSSMGGFPVSGNLIRHGFLLSIAFELRGPVFPTPRLSAVSDYMVVGPPVS